MKNKIYILELSTKRSILIDEEDYLKFETHSSQGNFVRLKQGIVNPSYVTAILPKEEIKKEEIVDGYIDEKTGMFVPTKIADTGGKLEDKMKPVSQFLKKYEG